MEEGDGGPQLLMGRLLVTGAITVQKDFEMGGSRLLRSGLVQYLFMLHKEGKIATPKITYEWLFWGTRNWLIPLRPESSQFSQGVFTFTGVG